MIGEVKISRTLVEGWFESGGSQTEASVLVYLDNHKIHEISADSSSSNNVTTQTFEFPLTYSLRKYIHSSKSLSFRVGETVLPVKANEQVIWPSQKVGDVQELLNLLEKGLRFNAKGHLVWQSLIPLEKKYELLEIKVLNREWANANTIIDDCLEILEKAKLPNTKPSWLRDKIWDENKNLLDLNVLLGLLKIKAEMEALGKIYAQASVHQFFLVGNHDISQIKEFKARLDLLDRREREDLFEFIFQIYDRSLVDNHKFVYVDTINKLPTRDLERDRLVANNIKRLIIALGLSWSGKILGRSVPYVDQYPDQTKVLIIADFLPQGKVCYLDQFLIKIATKENPDSRLIYLTEKRQRATHSLKLPADIVEIEILNSEETNLYEILPYVSKVYTSESFLGLDALVFGKTVTVTGHPFYAGWGLTDDRADIKNRKRQLTLNALVHLLCLMATSSTDMESKFIESGLAVGFLKRFDDKLRILANKVIKSPNYYSTKTSFEIFNTLDILISPRKFNQPGLLKLRLALSEVIFKNGNRKEALDQLSKLSQTFSCELDYSFYKVQSEIYRFCGSYGLALEAAEKSLLLIPVSKTYKSNYLSTLELKSKALCELERHDEAFEFLIQALNNFEFWNNQCLTMVRKTITSAANLTKFKNYLIPQLSYDGLRALSSLFHYSVASRDLGYYDEAILAISKRYIVGVTKKIYKYSGKTKSDNSAFISSARIALKNLAEDLKKFKLNFFLISGTLLGAVRENTILGHDKDIDVGLFGDFDMEALLKHLRESGRFYVFPIISDKLIRLKHANNVMIDVFIHWKEDGRIHHRGQKAGWWNSEFELTQIDFLGEPFLIPQNYDLYLTENYGDWRTPNSEFETFCDTPNMYCYHEQELLWYYYRVLLDHYYAGNKVQYYKVWNALNQMSDVPWQVKQAFDVSEGIIKKYEENLPPQSGEG